MLNEKEDSVTSRITKTRQKETRCRNVLEKNPMIRCEGNEGVVMKVHHREEEAMRATTVGRRDVLRSRMVQEVLQ